MQPGLQKTKQNYTECPGCWPISLIQSASGFCNVENHQELQFNVLCYYEIRIAINAVWLVDMDVNY